MTLYRVLRPLSTGHRRGDLVEGERFKSLDVLVRVNALARVSHPPLSVLPGWETRAEKLAEAGIVTVQEFLDAEDDILKEIFNHKTTRAISKWRGQLMKWLVVDEPKTRD